MSKETNEDRPQLWLHLEAKAIAEDVVRQLSPHCHRIEIAGSIRRKRKWSKDIEIVCIPKPYDTGLFLSGFAEVVSQWKKIKGELEYGVLRYTQRVHPTGITIDIFITTEDSWGYQLAIRTGPWDYSKNVLAAGWVSRGYKGVEGQLTYKGKPVIVREERDLFQRIGLNYVEPENRIYNPPKGKSKPYYRR